MKKKQPLLFILVGIGCATLAVVVLRKYMGGPPPEAPKPVGVKMLLATREIGYGEQIVVDGKQANARFFSGWPEKLKPEGCFTDPAALKERDLRAVADIVKHQPIVEAVVVDDEDFIPPDMTVQTLPVESKDIRIADIQPGMIVDIFFVDKQVPRPFMQNAKVYAMGRLDRHRRPVIEKNPPPTMHILIRKEDTLTFMTAVAGKRLKVIEAANPSAGGPTIVDDTVDNRMRRDDAQDMLAAAKAVMQEGDYGAARTQFEKIMADYPEFRDLTSDAKERADQCINRIANQLYDKANQAFIGDNYALALEFIDEIERTCPGAETVVRKARQLKAEVLEAVAANRALTRYQSMLADLQRALAVGNLPRAAELVDQVEAFDAESLPKDADVQSPADAATDYKDKLHEAQSKFKIDKAVVEAHVKQNNLDLARQKLDEMRAEFPAHPDITALEDLVNGAGA